jgi:transcriptional regulator with XRE-family HTH domain
MAQLKFGTMLDTAKLKDERERRKLSMAAAARIVGMKAQAWERIENGDGLSLTLKSLNRMASALKIPAKDLLR